MSKKRTFKKELTASDVEEMRAEAAELNKSRAAATYTALYPIFLEFTDRKQCFDFLVEKGVLSPAQFGSFQTYWYRAKSDEKEAV